MSKKGKVLDNDEYVGDVKAVLDGSRCPICKLGNGAMCVEHALLCKNFKWIKNYINNLEEFDRNTIYVLESTISSRVSTIINDVEIIDGRLAIEEYLDKKNCSVNMEKILKEIILLRKALLFVVNEVEKEGMNKCK